MKGNTLITMILAAAVFCLCFIAAIRHEQATILGTPYELTAKPESTLKNSTVTAVGQIDGVVESGYYMTQTLTLTVGGYSVSLTVQGVSADYTIDGHNVGSGITLNKAAIEKIEDEYADDRKTFTDYYTPRYNLGSDEMTFNLDAVVPNLADNESALAYMNVNQMSLLMKKLGKDGTLNQLIIKLADYSYLDSVKDALDSLDIIITSDTSAITKKAEEYNIHTLYLSIILGIAVLAVLDARKRIDGTAVLAGYFIGTGAAFCLPYLLPPAERSEAVFGLATPGWFYIAAFAAAAAIAVLKEIHSTSAYTD